MILLKYSKNIKMISLNQDGKNFWNYMVIKLQNYQKEKFVFGIVFRDNRMMELVIWQKGQRELLGKYFLKIDVEIIKQVYFCNYQSIFFEILLVMLIFI